MTKTVQQKRKQTLQSMKVTARYLYVYESLTADEVSKRVMVTPKTIGKWVNQFGWRDERERLQQRKFTDQIELDARDNILIGKLRVFLSKRHPRSYKTIERSIDDFIQLNMKENKDNTSLNDH